MRESAVDDVMAYIDAVCPYSNYAISAIGTEKAGHAGGITLLAGESRTVSTVQ
jgi:hypothetical protein